MAPVSILALLPEAVGALCMWPMSHSLSTSELTLPKPQGPPVLAVAIVDSVLILVTSQQNRHGDGGDPPVCSAPLSLASVEPLGFPTSLSPLPVPRGAQWGPSLVLLRPQPPSLVSSRLIALNIVYAWMLPNSKPQPYVPLSSTRVCPALTPYFLMPRGLLTTRN